MTWPRVFPVREATDTDLEGLAQLWHDAWHDAHAAIVPPDLVALRTPADFRQRLPALIPALRTAGPAGHPMGLCIVRNDEMHQLFLDAAVRGSGLAAALLADAEARLAAAGVRQAWLDVAIGNDRAIHFYRREGWQLGKVADMPLDTATGLGRFELRVQIMTKCLP